MPLQKSFSDQNHTSTGRNRQFWNRNKSHSFARHDNTRATNTAKPQPPLPISSATKQKLNVFQFAGQATDQATTADMVIPDTAIERSDNEGATAPIRSENFHGTAQKSTTQSPHDELMKPPVFPITPAGKLAFADLIGMVDVKTPEVETSPDDRIMWAHNSTDIPSSASSYGPRRPKRARSSSPLSSPARPSTHFPGRTNIHETNQAKTPQTELRDDLWERYGGGKTLVKGAGISTLSHILFSSSPQSSKQASVHKSESRLRRSITCGSQWPKRRKHAEPDDPSAGDSVGDASTGAVPSKFLRISALLDKVQEGYSVRKDRGLPLELPSASSIQRSAVPDAARQAENGSAQLGETRTAMEAVNSDDTLVDEGPHMEMTDSSDYGDFDDDEFDTSLVDVCVQQHATLQTVRSKQEAWPPPSIGKIRSGGATPILERMRVDEQSPKQQELVTIIDEDEDEFGDMDDVDVGDLEGIAAKYDESSMVSSKARSNSTDQVTIDAATITTTTTTTIKPSEDSGDEFGDDLDDIDFEAVEAAATQSLHQSASSVPPSSQKARAIQRYLVISITESDYEDARGKSCSEKVLFVSIEKTDTVRAILLREGWFDTPVTENAYVHVIGDFDNSQIIIDDARNMLILHPDHLVSSTVVADSFSCTRRAVLQDRVKATGDVSRPLVYGTILHEVFQAAMLANRWDTEWLSSTIIEITTRHVEELYVIKLQIPEAIEHLQSKMVELQCWAELFVSSKPKPDAVIKANNNSGQATMCISKLLDVEEHVWSPMYGLKGNIDATVQVTMREGDEDRTLTVPFEVKTGKRANASHRAQTALYNLLLSDRYDIDVTCGILYYMETSETIRIPAIRHEIRHMIMQRNQLACYVRERHAELPPMLKNSNMCNNCYAKVPCFIYSRIADDGTGETTGLKQKFDDVVKHLTPTHQAFFMKWDDLLTKEEKESMRFRRELWTMLSTEREKLGRCFSNVIIEPGSAHEDEHTSKINRYTYTMMKAEANPEFSFRDSQMTVGEPVVISDEMGHFALANGYVTVVHKHRISVAVDRRLHNARIRRAGFDGDNNQTFASIMEVAGEGEILPPTSTKIAESPVLYRLDKDEFSNGMATVRNNLIQIMADGKFGSREIRSLVVDLVIPNFKSKPTGYILNDQSSINLDQKSAIAKVMSAQDYALVLGMPGTGKTTTIAHIIRALVSQGKSVLLTSYTHTAVDNILLKLKEDNIPILRLGTAAKVHPDVQDFVTLASKPMDTFDDIRNAWHGSPIVATTCLGINHPLFSERTFDYCIVDEASQITLPVCLGPIRMAHTFVLVGDHYQLPPLVQNEEARTGGLDISLFKLLSDAHPSSVVNLEHQYRMCEDVMTLSNELIYSGRLKCGTPEVASREIHIPDMEALRLLHRTPSALSRSQKSICANPTPGKCWLRDMVDPSTKVRFLNTDKLPNSGEESKGNRIVNHTEARVVSQLVESLLSVGIEASSIGVMTHYRSQLSVLKETLSRHKDIEMHTADRFQGRDKEVIILSLVRSNENHSIGELLKDWRRINVAFTRAKTKLLVVGSRDTLKGDDDSEEMVSKFVGLMEQRRWVFDLPKDALEMHTFADWGTQGTACTGSSGGVHGSQRQRLSPLKRKGRESAIGKENKTPRKAAIGQRALFSGRPVLRDVARELGVSEWNM